MHGTTWTDPPELHHHGARIADLVPGWMAPAPIGLPPAARSWLDAFDADHGIGRDGTRYGIRPHRPMSPADADRARRMAEHDAARMATPEGMAETRARLALQGLTEHTPPPLTTPLPTAPLVYRATCRQALAWRRELVPADPDRPRFLVPPAWIAPAGTDRPDSVPPPAPWEPIEDAREHLVAMHRRTQGRGVVDLVTTASPSEMAHARAAGEPILPRVPVRVHLVHGITWTDDVDTPNPSGPDAHPVHRTTWEQLSAHAADERTRSPWPADATEQHPAGQWAGELRDDLLTRWRAEHDRQILGDPQGQTLRGILADPDAPRIAPGPPIPESAWQRIPIETDPAIPEDVAVLVAHAPQEATPVPDPTQDDDRAEALRAHLDAHPPTDRRHPTPEQAERIARATAIADASDVHQAERAAARADAIRAELDALPEVDPWTGSRAHLDAHRSRLRRELDAAESLPAPGTGECTVCGDDVITLDGRLTHVASYGDTLHAPQLTAPGQTETDPDTTAPLQWLSDDARLWTAPAGTPWPHSTHGEPGTPWVRDRRTGSYSGQPGPIPRPDGWKPGDRWQPGGHTPDCARAPWMETWAGTDGREHGDAPNLQTRGPACTCAQWDRIPGVADRWAQAARDAHVLTFTPAPTPEPGQLVEIPQADGTTMVAPAGSAAADFLQRAADGRQQRATPDPGIVAAGGAVAPLAALFDLPETPDDDAEPVTFEDAPEEDVPGWDDDQDDDEPDAPRCLHCGSPFPTRAALIAAHVCPQDDDPDDVDPEVVAALMLANHAAAVADAQDPGPDPTRPSCPLRPWADCIPNQGMTTDGCVRECGRLVAVLTRVDDEATAQADALAAFYGRTADDIDRWGTTEERLRWHAYHDGRKVREAAEAKQEAGMWAGMARASEREAYACSRPGPHTHHLSHAARIALRLPTGVPWRFVLRHGWQAYPCPADRVRQLALQCPPAEHGHLTALGRLVHPGQPDRRSRLFDLARRLNLTTRPCPRSPR